MLLLMPAGCGLTLREDLHDPDPAAKIPAIVGVGEGRDGTASEAEKRGLVAALEHDDPAVRLFAIETLRRMTGETRGYVAYAEPEGRGAAVQAWREWLEEREGEGTADERR